MPNINLCIFVLTKQIFLLPFFGIVHTQRANGLGGYILISSRMASFYPFVYVFGSERA